MSGTVLPLSEGSFSTASGAGAKRLDLLAETLQHRHDDALLLLEQAEQQVGGRHLGVGVLGGEPLRGRHGLLGLDREPVGCMPG